MRTRSDRSSDVRSGTSTWSPSCGGSLGLTIATDRLEADARRASVGQGGRRSRPATRRTSRRSARGRWRRPGRAASRGRRPAPRRRRRCRRPAPRARRRSRPTRAMEKRRDAGHERGRDEASSRLPRSPQAAPNAGGGWRWSGTRTSVRTAAASTRAWARLHARRWSGLGSQGRRRERRALRRQRHDPDQSQGRLPLQGGVGRGSRSALGPRRGGPGDRPGYTARVAPTRLLLAAPRGYCAGVDRPCRRSSRRSTCYGPPVYVRKEIVHNKHVVESCAQRGAIFVDRGDRGARGRHRRLLRPRRRARGPRERGTRGLNTIDATCPLVTKVHVEARSSPPRATRSSCRPRGPRGGRGHHRRGARAASCSSRPWRTPSALDVDDPDTRRLHDADDALGRRDARRSSPRCASASRTSSAPRNDDICYATRTARRPSRSSPRECDLVLVIGSTQLVQLEPPGRGRARARRRRPT